MLDSRDIGGLQGAPVLGADNDKLGTVGQVFVDATTGAPNWVTVKSGLFGRKETFVPLANSTWDGEQVHVDIDRDTFAEAPRIDAEESLTPHNEEALYRYYGLSDVDTDGGTARPGDYPDREYAISADGEMVTPVSPTGTTGVETDATGSRETDATTRDTHDAHASRDLRLSEQPLGEQQPGEQQLGEQQLGEAADPAADGATSGRHARLRRYDPATDGTSTTGDPTIDRSNPPRAL